MRLRSLRGQRFQRSVGDKDQGGRTPARAALFRWYDVRRNHNCERQSPKGKNCFVADRGQIGEIDSLTMLRLILLRPVLVQDPFALYVPWFKNISINFDISAAVDVPELAAPVTSRFDGRRPQVSRQRVRVQPWHYYLAKLLSPSQTATSPKARTSVFQPDRSMTALIRAPRLHRPRKIQG